MNLPYRNIRRNAVGGIDVDIELPGLGWVPYTLTEDSEYEWAAPLLQAVADGTAGPVAPYAPNVDELRRQYEVAASRRILARLQAAGFDDQGQLAAYAATPGRYQEEALALQRWIVDVWSAWEALTADQMAPYQAEAWAGGL